MFMNRRLSNISVSLLGLLCMSLVLSTTHSHEALQSQMEQHQQTVPHTLESNTIVCPICGYLFKAQLTSVPDTDSFMYPGQSLAQYTSTDPQGQTLIDRPGRSPPLFPI